MRGEPFVCGTRQTLQQTVHEVELSVEDVYLTYVLKRRATRAYDKKQDRQAYRAHLEQQLRTKSPLFVIYGLDFFRTGRCLLIAILGKRN
ncbi:MAG: hypothetical protein M0Z65_06510 [Firmicutes bacterium]|uniref:Uracil DNA glycosylase superfamily protein n=1 Tax=Melghirimyces thermohalophilus TaxID=1236220 RepID=A0A1G6LVW5_9BACL|nr:hypothetical protein [Melghirimyces thermohalophilus]MDA8352834.1 hypothetical protein [Bacillota bacterium]SDC47448.1 Uracil DNA glycosylase superfamily protein [Melghirimyces thermohalophilus]